LEFKYEKRIFGTFTYDRITCEGVPPTLWLFQSLLLFGILESFDGTLSTESK
jgi:hypothetical protein